MSTVLKLPGYGVNGSDTYVPVDKITHWHLIDYNGNYGSKVFLENGSAFNVGIWPDELKARIDAAQAKEEK